MRDPLSRLISSFQSSQDSWLQRIRENLYQFLTPAQAFPSSANGAPIHLLTHKRSSIASGPRVAAFFTHAALLAAILLLRAQSPVRKAHSVIADIPGGSRIVAPLDSNLFGHPSLEKKGGGGEEESEPARRGFLAPASSMPILPPRKETPTTAELQVPEAVFDANAPQFPAPVTYLGLPWMKNDTHSAGPGTDHGFGSGHKGGMGDDAGPDAGQGEAYNGPYANLLSRALCVYCPDPEYTEEARKAKIQGTVTLKVLVGADGRASQIRFVSGVGLGLDERALETVRGWKFAPAKDAARRPVPTWVTIEVIFRLM